MAKITDSIVAQLNAQMGRELAASQQYLAMAVHLDAKSLEQLAGFFFSQAEEEREHAMKFLRYLLEVGATPVVGALAAPPAEFESLTQIVETSLAYEEAVTAAIHDIVDAATAERDYATVRFLQWFVLEQIEEEATFNKLLDIINMSQNVLQVEGYVRHMGAPAEPEEA